MGLKINMEDAKPKSGTITVSTEAGELFRRIGRAEGRGRDTTGLLFDMIREYVKNVHPEWDVVEESVPEPPVAQQALPVVEPEPPKPKPSTKPASTKPASKKPAKRR